MSEVEIYSFWIIQVFKLISVGYCRLNALKDREVDVGSEDVTTNMFCLENYVLYNNHTWLLFDNFVGNLA